MNINIGITGVAGSGKDTLCNLIVERLSKFNIKSIRLSLGDELRLELRDFCISNYGIDPCNCSREQKDSIRDLFVFHGNYRRDSSKGSHWSSKIYDQMTKISESSKNGEKLCFIIPDIRYDKHEKDDLFFIKTRLEGVLIHLSRYKLDKNGVKVYHPPANEQEKIFDPRMKKQSDFCIEWPESSNFSLLSPYVDIVINNLKEKYNNFFKIN